MIDNHDRAAQVIEFDGLMFGTGYPTDIDGLLEWHNKAYVLFELKFKGASMSLGQSLALERLCDTLGESKPTLLVLAEHETPIGMDVIAAESIVVKYRYGGRWKTEKAGMTLRQIMDDFLLFVESE